MKRLAVLCVLLLPSLPSIGAPWQLQAPIHLAERGSAAQPRITMGDAMEQVRRAFGGRVLAAQPTTVNGREGYRIKILTARGEVKVVYVDGETGAMSE